MKLIKLRHRHSGEGRNPARINIPRSGQRLDVVTPYEDGDYCVMPAVRRADVPARGRPVGAPFGDENLYEARRRCLHPSAQRSVIRRMCCVTAGSPRKELPC